MDKKEVLEQLVKGLKQIKDDLSKKEVKEAIADMKTAVGTMKEDVKKLPEKPKLAKDQKDERVATSKDYFDSGDAASAAASKKQVKGSPNAAGALANKHLDTAHQKAAKEKLSKDVNTEITKKVNTAGAMNALKAASAKKMAKPVEPHNPPPSNEITKKVLKSDNAENTSEDSAGKQVEKISQGSKNTSEAAKNLQNKDNYPKHTQEKAKKQGLSPFMLARKSKVGK